MKRKLLIPFLASAFLFVSCEKKEIVNKGTIDVQFTHKVKDENFALTSRIYPSGFNYNYSFTSFKYIISELYIVNANGDKVNLIDAPRIIDVNRVESLQFKVRNVNDGLIDKVVVVCGLPENFNNSVQLSGNRADEMRLENGVGAFNFFMIKGNVLKDEGATNESFELMSFSTPNSSNEKTIVFEKPILFNNQMTLSVEFDLHKLLNQPNKIDVSLLADREADLNKISEQLMNNIESALSVSMIVEAE